MKKKILNSVLLLVSFSLLNLFCRKQISNSPQDQNLGPSVTVNNSSLNQKGGKKIRVSNVYELYDAINDPANEGNQILLEQGTYILVPNYPNTGNSGRLELQRDMQLIGQPGHPESVVIDASTLPDASFNPPSDYPAKRTGAIRMGKGFNTIEWLKVKGNSNAKPLSVIDTDLIGDGICYIRIAHTIITGGRIGIDIRNVGPASVGRTIEAEIEDNELTGNLVSDAGTQQGQGIVMQNANGAFGATIRVTMRRNYVHGNIRGMRAFNNNGNANTHTDNSSIIIKSYGDRFDENNLGITLDGGANTGTMATNSTVNGNLLSFEANGTSIQNNRDIQPDPATLPCGILVKGGSNSIAGSESSNNRVDLKLTGCTISGNQDYDIISYGAFSTTLTLPGTNNVINIYLNGVSGKAKVAPPVGSVPTEVAGTNVVNVFK